MPEMKGRAIKLYNEEIFGIPIQIAAQLGTNLASLTRIAKRAPPLETHEIFDTSFKWFRELMGGTLEENGLLTPTADYNVTPDPLFWATEFTRQRYLERFHRLDLDAGLKRAPPYMASMFYLSANAIATEDTGTFGSYTAVARAKYEEHALKRIEFAVDEGDYVLRDL